MNARTSQSDFMPINLSFAFSSSVSLYKILGSFVISKFQVASTLATSCEELTHWKRLWCWEGLGAGGEGDNRGWDGWMASLTLWTWVSVNSGSWWWTGRPGVLRFMGSQRVGHDWATDLIWSDGEEGPLEDKTHLEKNRAERQKEGHAKKSDK